MTGMTEPAPSAASSLAPLLRGEGWGEGQTQALSLGLAETPPSPGSSLRDDPTSPRARGEVALCS
ncbi:hypothetical protein RPYSC3_45450 [Rhodopseudomonas palustris]|nr:hypothetical protein RPYSC3_45450 [Rhodopseudomonas palustris]